MKAVGRHTFTSNSAELSIFKLYMLPSRPRLEGKGVWTVHREIMAEETFVINRVAETWGIAEARNIVVPCRMSPHVCR
jgi:hypothetical protein